MGGFLYRPCDVSLETLRELTEMFDRSKWLSENFAARKNSGSYFYVSKEDSDTYDAVRNSTDEKDQKIKQLIEDKAVACYDNHCRCTR